MRYVFALLLAFSAVGAVFAQESGSLWSDETGPIFRDLRAHNIGDVLTVVVSETSSASSQAATKTSKDESISVDAGIGPILANLIPNWKAGGSEASNASGSTTRSGSLTARMSVCVKKVLPNGNLLIEGKRDVMVNKENQTLVLTGTVRPSDVGTDNTIPSYLIADAKIQYEGKGPIGDKQRDGVFIRIFKWLFGGLIK